MADRAALKVAEWQKQQPVFERIQQAGGFAAYVSALDLSNACKPVDTILRCMDEGTIHGFHLAGSGILLKPGELDEAVKKLKTAGLSGISSHAGCGAAKLAAESVGRTDVDVYAEECSRKLAEKAGLTYIGQIRAEELKRPADLHIARVVYYDQTGRFDWAQVPGLPLGFSIGRAYLSVESAQNELTIAAQIAFGEHGFDDQFSTQEPLFIITVGPSADQNRLQQEVEPVVAHYGDRIIVDHLDVPTK